MNLTTLIHYLNTRLIEDLPGKWAHDMMKPMLANGSPIRIRHQDPPKQGGVLILFYEENGIVRFPMIQRPEYEGIHSGQIALPGGKRETSDRDLIQTALRETEEEIGVEQSEIEVIGSLSPFFVAASNYDILPVIGVTSQLPSFRPDPREVNAIITPGATDLLDEKKIKTKDITVRNGFKLRSPYFDLEDHVVWGATAMMLSELRQVLSGYTLS